MGSTQERTETAVSPTLAQAQEKLLELRQSLSLSSAQSTGDLDQAPLPQSPHQSTLFEQINKLPSHLGWESAGVTAVLRQNSMRDAADVIRVVHPQKVTHHASCSMPPKERAHSIKVYPGVAQGILREGHAAAGRVWLLLRYLDENGRGWVTESEAQEQLTTKTAPTYIFGKRQWRNIVKKGSGVFWQKENGRLWLYSVSKTAAALGVWQLTGQPVMLPIAALTSKIGTVRAHLYATFHSSRSVARSAGRSQQQTKPIARETLTEHFNISPRTQRSYERKARVQAHQNYAIGKKETAETTKDAAWQHGAAAFSLTDHLGKNGRSGTTYLAWQLPNHYFGPHQQACRGQQKRINRELADLFMKGMTGNGNETVDGRSNSTTEARRTQRKNKNFAPSASLRFVTPRRFFANGAAAAKVYNRSQARQDVYWRSANQGVWHVLEKKTGD